MHQQTLSSTFKASRRLALPVLLSGSVLMTTACGTQGFGVGRNPLGRGVKEGVQSTAAIANALFDGNPELLNSLFLRSKTKNLLQPGQTVALEVIAIDRNGKRIDPSKLDLSFISSLDKNVTVDKNGILTGVTPFESSEIKVIDKKTGASAVIDVTVGPKEYTGNPEALASLSLMLRQQTVPGKGEQAQYHVVAKDILGNPIDPSRLRLEWTLSKPEEFSVDKNGLVTSLTPTGISDLLVRDTVTGRIASGTVRNISLANTVVAPPKGTGNTITTNPNPIPSGAPGVPVTPTGPSQGNTNPLQPPLVNDGTPGTAASITLTPALSNLRPGERVQLNVALLDNQGRTINPSSVALQWTSSESGLPVDGNGVVTANTSDRSTRVTVTVPGTNLSASVIVNALSYPSTGGGGGGGGGGNPIIPGPTVIVNPSVPTTYSTTLSVNSFTVHITPPATTPVAIAQYRVTVGNAPGNPTFLVPAGGGVVSAQVPLAAGLLPNTTYPYSVVALDADGNQSAVVNAFGTTLFNLQPVNLIGGSNNFSGLLAVPANGSLALNRVNGNALGAGDASPMETLTITLQPTAANFGTVSLVPNNPAGVTVTGAGTFASPLVISGSRAAVDEALNNFVYTPAVGFTGPATVTMTNVDTIELGATPDDVDTLVFSVNSATPTPPQNTMNNNPVFANLNTALNTPLTLNPLNNSQLNANDINGDQLTVRLTPSNGTLNLVSVPAGVTVTGTGTAADPLQIVGRPFNINGALNGGLTFTPTTSYTGPATIQMQTTAPDGTDTDTVNITVIQPSNIFNGVQTFPTPAVRMAKSQATTLNAATSRALGVIYPASSNVQVNLILLDEFGNNPGAAAHGTLAIGAMAGVAVTSPGGPATLQLVGNVTAVNALLASGLIYSPFGATTGRFRLQMNSFDTLTPALTDTNDILNLEVSELPVNRFNNSASAFPPVGAPIELGFDTPLTFAGFFGTPLSVVDTDSTTITVTLTPSNNGKLSRANTNPTPAGVTVTNSNGGTSLPPGSTGSIEATNANPMVITGSPTNINAFLNNGIVFTPNQGFSGAATVTMRSDDGGGTDTDITHINVLPVPENRRNDNPNFTTHIAILSAPGVEMDLSNPATRLLSVRNYPASNSNVEVTLSVPAGKGSLRINGVAGATGTLSSVNVSGNLTNNVTLIGTQTNLNTVLQSLRYTPDATAVAAPETVNLTMNSTGGPLGDAGDLVPFSISNPPRNIYNAQDANEAAENTSFPAPASRLDIFSDQALVLNNTATATQPAARLDVVDDSANVTVTLTPANTAGNTAAVIDTTVAVPGTVTNTGAGTNASPRVLSGPLADVKTAMTLLRYTPQAGFTGPTSFNVVSSDGGPSPDTNTVELNVRALAQNEFNTLTVTFPTTNILMVQGIANPIADDGSGVNTTVHEIGVRNLNSYIAGQTATVRLQIPNGSLSVTASGGVTVTGNGTGDVLLTATHPNITNINAVLGTLTWTPAALANGVAPTVAVLTMTHNPLTDMDTLNLLATRPPRNLFGGVAAFPATRLVVNEGTPQTFTAANLVSVGSETVETVEDSPAIRTTLTPSLLGGNNSGVVDVTTSGAATKSGAGTNASPLVINGTPADVNATLASLSFTSAAGANGNAQIDMVTTDFAARDINDSILLDLRARPSNRVTLDGNTSNTFPGTGAARNVPLNAIYQLDGHNNATASLDRPLVQVAFYNAADTVTVNLSLAPNQGTLQVNNGTAGVVVTGNSTGAVQLVGSQANVNIELATLRYNSSNTAGNVDMQVLSSNGTVGDNTPNQDVIRFNVQNQAPINSFTGTNSGFTNTTGNTPLPLRVVSDTTTVDDEINFGQGDPTSAAAGNLSVTTNSWGTLSVADDDATVTTTVTPPNTGLLSDRNGTGFAATGAGVTGAGSSVSPFVFTGSPAQINAALLRLRFTPNNNVVSGTTANLTIHTVDGAAQSDTDTMAILVERPNLPATFSSNPNPAGTIFHAVYQLGRDKLPQIVVNDVTVSGPELQAGAQIEIIRYNDNNPTDPGDDTTTVLRTVTLNNPNAGLGESVSFNNQTNRATVTVDFSVAGAPVLSTLFPDGRGKIGGRLVGGNVDTPSTSSVAAADHPYFYFVFPDRAQYAVEDYFSGANNRGRWYLINTNSSVGSGLGRLSMIFDSNGSFNLTNGLNATTDVTTGLAKNPINGDVYYVDQQGTSPAFSGRLMRWIPSRGIQNDRGGADTGTDPFLPRGGLTVNNGNGTLYSFGDKPARLEFNSTIVGATKTATLYAGANYQTVDGQTPFSGFYRITNYESGTPSVDHIALTLNGDDFGAFDAYLNNGDLVFEPDTDAGATANNRMFISMSNRLYVTTAPVPDTGTADVALQQITIPAGVRTTLTSDGTAGGVQADQLVGLSIDGEWTAGNRSLLVIARYTTNGATLNLSKLYRLNYDATYAITGATLLANGNFTTPTYAGPIPLVDITAAHTP